jgi:hypothetical protein
MLDGILDVTLRTTKLKLKLKQGLAAKVFDSLDGSKEKQIDQGSC